MAEYIDRESTIAAIRDKYTMTFDRPYLIQVLCSVLDVPTADVVPVVRCKDCVWFGRLGCAISIVNDADRPKKNDFCSFGERKDGDFNG